MKYLVKILTVVVIFLHLNGVTKAQHVTSVNGATGDVQIGLSLTNKILSIDDGNSVILPYGIGNITSVTTGNDLLGEGSSGNITINANSESALWNANQLKGFPVAGSVPVSGQLLKWGTSEWIPSTDDNLWMKNENDIHTLLNVGIGTLPTQFALTVNGKIHATRVEVTLNEPGPDYVFKKDYDLMPLEELNRFVKTNRHLPEVHPGSKMEKAGIELSKMGMLLLKKTEELTLYMLENEKRIKLLESIQ